MDLRMEMKNPGGAVCIPIIYCIVAEFVFVTVQQDGVPVPSGFHSLKTNQVIGLQVCPFKNLGKQ